MPLMVLVALGLVSTIVSVELVFSWTLTGENDFTTVGGATVVTTRFAVAAAPVPALVVLTVPVELTKVLVGAGAVVLVTLTDKVHEPLGASVPADMPKVPIAATPPTSVALEPAVQLIVAFAGVALIIVPAGAPAT